MTDKEQIMIDGVNVSRCKYLPYCNDKQGNCAFEPNCYFKQLARKTQLSIKQSKELIRLRKELQESTVKNRNLKQECEEMKERLVRTEEDLKYQCVDCMNCQSDRYRKALEELKERLVRTEEDLKYQCVYCMNCQSDRYRKALRRLRK